MVVGRIFTELFFKVVTAVRQRIKELHVFEGMGRKRVQSVKSGDICALIGIEGFEIGDTVADAENPEPLPRIAIDEPTMSMTFTINDSPFFGRDGKFRMFINLPMK